MTSTPQRTGRAAAAALFVAAAAFSAFATDFKDTFRTPSASYFITPIGEIYVIRPGGGLQKAFQFRDAHNLPYRWSRLPLSFVQWKAQWIVADGSSQLARFRENGVFDSMIGVPVRVPRLAAT